jgi:PDZ domain-containing secreted protein
VSGAFVQGFIRDFTRAEIIVRVDGKEVSTKEEIEEYLGSVERGKGVRFEFRLASKSGPAREEVIVPEWQ